MCTVYALFVEIFHFHALLKPSTIQEMSREKYVINYVVCCVCVRDVMPQCTVAISIYHLFPQQYSKLNNINIHFENVEHTLHFSLNSEEVNLRLQSHQEHTHYNKLTP